MKVRKGFVSNSSSSSFIVSLKLMPIELSSKILKMTDYSNDLGRNTGIISNIREWCSQDHYSVPAFLDKYFDNNDVLIVRESDENLGGCFANYGFTEEDLEPYVLGEFEWH